MKVTIAVAAGLLAASMSVPAIASDLPDIQHGNGLLEYCSAEADAHFDQGLCAGYIAGVRDVGGALGHICYPNTVDNGQLQDIVIAGLNAHPEERHYHSEVLVIKYLAAAFPCPTKK